MTGEEHVDSVIDAYDTFAKTGDARNLKEIPKMWDDYFESTGCGWCKQKSMEHKWQAQALINAVNTGGNLDDIRKAAKHMSELATYQREVSGEAQSFAAKIGPLGTDKVTARIQEIDDKFGTYTPPPEVPSGHKTHTKHPRDAAKTPSAKAEQPTHSEAGKVASVITSKGEAPFVGLGGYEIPEPESIFDLQLIPAPEQLIGSVGDTFSFPKPPALPKPPGIRKILDPLGLIQL